jgi:hypothetical protein
MPACLFRYALQENTNKAVIADLYIHDADLATSAFAAVAFTSGLAGRRGAQCITVQHI